MRWRGRARSGRVFDRRGQRMPMRRGGGGLLQLVLLLFFRGSMKMKLILLAALAVGFLLFREPLMNAFGLAGGYPAAEMQQQAPPSDETGAFLATLMGDNERVWSRVLPAAGLAFRPATMIIYTQATRTPEGIADARMGPFYLPGNETIYLDPTFFAELKQKFGAQGDFAEAYVVAHEYGHHVQQLMGRLKQLHSLKGRVSQAEYNRSSVRVELHADFLAGVFAHHGEEIFSEFLEQGDIEEAMAAAAAIGDDRIQKRYGSGTIKPESFTHGTSDQRARWFNRGFQSGDLRTGEQLYTLPYEQL